MEHIAPDADEARCMRAAMAATHTLTTPVRLLDAMSDSRMWSKPVEVVHSHSCVDTRLAFVSVPSRPELGTFPANPRNLKRI